jgi:hypothetical protein
MSAPPVEPAARHAAEILLGYLQCRADRLWPGGDSVTLDDVLRSYPQAASARLVPDLPELLRRFPDLAAEFAVWFVAAAPAPPGRR